MAPATRTRDWAEIDFYAVLGVGTDASDDDLARAYRTLAKQLHPDSGATAGQVEQFRDVRSAYDVLRNPELRREYDRVRGVVRLDWVHGPAPASRRATRSVPLTRRRAWMVTIAGIAAIVAAVVVGFVTMTLRASDADVRATTVPVDAVRFERDGRSFVMFVTADDVGVTAPEPERQEPGAVGAVVRVRYDPDDPQHVVADENHGPRDITLAIVAVKLLVGGVVFAAIGARRVRASRVAR